MTSTPSQGGLDLEMVEGLEIYLKDAMSIAISTNDGVMLRARNVAAMLAVIRQARKLRRVREAAVELAGMIERFRPLDAAFGSPSPFALIEEAQDKLRAALADGPANSAATSSRLADGSPALADSEEGRDDHMPDRDPEETGSKSSSREG